jgi:hypothetical protein
VNIGLEIKICIFGEKQKVFWRDYCVVSEVMSIVAAATAFGTFFLQAVEQGP